MINDDNIIVIIIIFIRGLTNLLQVTGTRIIYNLKLLFSFDLQIQKCLLLESNRYYYNNKHNNNNNKAFVETGYYRFPWKYTSDKDIKKLIIIITEMFSESCKF